MPVLRLSRVFRTPSYKRTPTSAKRRTRIPSTPDAASQHSRPQMADDFGHEVIHMRKNMLALAGALMLSVAVAGAQSGTSSSGSGSSGSGSGQSGSGSSSTMGSGSGQSGSGASTGS